jgi:hypothetical protein
LIRTSLYSPIRDKQNSSISTVVFKASNPKNGA